MPEVGDEIQLVATKVGREPRTGVVTDVRGRIITVRWPSGDQSLLVPAPGTLTVLRPVAKKAATKATTKATAKKAAQKAPVRETAKRQIPPKRGTVPKKPATKRSR